MENENPQINPEKEIEEKVEKAVTKNLYLVGNIILVLISVGMIYVVHNVQEWDHSFFDFIKEDFNKILWAVDLSLGATILVSIIKIFSRNKKYHKIGQIIDNTFSLPLLIVSLSVFPYDFRELIDQSWINTAVKGFLVFLIVVVFIAIIAESAKLASKNFSDKC